MVGHVRKISLGSKSITKRKEARLVAEGPNATSIDEMIRT